MKRSIISFVLGILTTAICFFGYAYITDKQIEKSFEQYRKNVFYEVVDSGSNNNFQFATIDHQSNAMDLSKITRRVILKPAKEQNKNSIEIKMSADGEWQSVGIFEKGSYSVPFLSASLDNNGLLKGAVLRGSSFSLIDKNFDGYIDTVMEHPIKAGESKVWYHMPEGSVEKIMGEPIVDSISGKKYRGYTWKDDNWILGLEFKD